MKCGSSINALVACIVGKKQDQLVEACKKQLHLRLVAVNGIRHAGLTEEAGDLRDCLRELAELSNDELEDGFVGVLCKCARLFGIGRGAARRDVEKLRL